MSARNPHERPAKILNMLWWAFWGAAGMYLAIKHGWVSP
jgi:hypothetical protein